MTGLDAAIESEVFDARILVVKDNSVNVILLEDLLANEGHRNVTSTTESRLVVALHGRARQDIHIEDAASLLAEEAGKHFDPDLVPDFVTVFLGKQRTQRWVSLSSMRRLRRLASSPCASSRG